MKGWLIITPPSGGYLLAPIGAQSIEDVVAATDSSATLVRAVANAVDPALLQPQAGAAQSAPAPAPSQTLLYPAPSQAAPAAPPPPPPPVTL